ncbi:MAG: hypothetical protein UU67_C0007G0022 [Candidatus Daviesbacteria bacterium GW2011_GWB1_41_5]|uniref:Uncharacterized protein n=1 Tax=Candidatus Daviesbacteria bacterium GW2011_GWB1_41_5 TaxID=1618429 RepID=A0A0G0YWV0_9BACT|nr:MAG: hypothetical protein UU67_C0007G0022 [Candidatus Daviesbacteria bacterium GW2011_GWB1_41_5]
MSGRQFFYILFVTFITIIVWVVMDIMHSRAEVQITPEIKKMMEPINPNFDQEVLNAL